MTVICYKTASGEQLWETSPGSAEVSLATWTAAHPDCQLLYQFQPDTSLAGLDTAQQEHFKRVCGWYGLTELDWNAPLLFADGTRGNIRGIEPRRRKYVVRVWRPDKQGYILYTLNSVKHAMENARRSYIPVTT